MVFNSSNPNRQLDRPAALLIEGYDPKSRRYTITRRQISVQGSARLIIDRDRKRNDLMRIRFTLPSGELTATVRLLKPSIKSGAPFLFEEYITPCRGAIIEDPVLGINRCGRQCSANLLERIVARCYALLRDQAIAADREMGYACNRIAQNALNRQWREGGSGNFQLYPSR